MLRDRFNMVSLKYIAKPFCFFKFVKSENFLSPSNNFDYLVDLTEKVKKERRLTRTIQKKFSKNIILGGKRCMFTLLNYLHNSSISIVVLKIDNKNSECSVIISLLVGIFPSLPYFLFITTSIYCI